MKFHFIVKHISQDGQSKYLLEKTEDKYCCFNINDPAINASFDRYKAEKFLTKKIFPEFYKEPTNKGQCPLSIKNLEFHHIVQFDTDTTQLYEVISHLKFDLEGLLEWIILDDRLEIDNTIQQYKQFLEEKEPEIELPVDHMVANFINKLVDASRKNKLVLFVGAGFSKNYGYPLWDEVMDRISINYGIKKIPDHLKFAQIFYNQLGQHEYFTFLSNIFLKTPTAPDNDLLKEIFSLNPLSIITTNYDDLLVNSIDNIDYQVITSNEDLAYTKTPKLIIKMHGDFKNNNIVFKEDDYLSYSRTHHLIENQVLALIASKTILIIGFSFEDINLKYIVQHIRDVHQKHFNKICIYFTDPKVPDSEIFYYTEKGLDVLTYSDDILYYLGKTHKLRNEISKELQLFSFLKLLNLSVKNEVNIAIQNPVEQAFNLFEKYNHLPTISPYQLRKIKPFNESGELNDAKFIPSRGIFNMKENQLWRRFNQIDFDYYDLSKSKDMFSNKLSEEEIKWWKRIFENNWYSFIWNYGIHNTHIHKISHSKDGTVREISERKDEGKIKESLQKCNVLAISGDINSNQIIEYNDAMYHLLYFGKRVYAAIIGAKLLAFYIDKKDFYNALRIIKILSDFKYQIKDDFDSDIPQYKRNEIYQLIHQYDVYEKLVEFNLSRFERANFLDVFGEEIPNRLYKESYEAYLTLEDNYKKYKIAGYESWGNDFKNDIYYTFGFLYNQAFFNYNPIFWYSNRKDFVNIFIYSNLISVNINEKYHGHNKDGLDEFFLVVYLQLLFPKDFKSFHDRFPEIRFKLGTSAKEYLKTYINNLFTSFITQDFGGKTVLDDYMKEEMNKSYFFKQDINYQLSKILTIMSYLDDVEFRDILVKDNIENFQFLIKERVIYDDSVLVEFAKILIDIDLVLYEKYLLNLREIKMGKDLSVEIFFEYINYTYKKFPLDKFDNKFNFVIDDFANLSHGYQIKFFRSLLNYKHESKINEIRSKIPTEKIKNNLLMAYLEYLSSNNIDAIFKLLDREIADNNIQTYTKDSVFYTNDEFTANSLYFVINDKILKNKLKNKKLGKYFEFALYPNEFDYKQINAKWLLTGHSQSNIKILTQSTIIQWFKHLNELKISYPEIKIDHLYKELGEAMGKLENNKD